MASPIPHERTLRKFTIATLLPAFPLLVASGAMSAKSQGWGPWGGYYVGPTIIYFGLIPTFFSAITSALNLKTTPDLFDKRPAWHTGLWFLIDAFLACANLAVLIPVWIFDPPAMYNHANWMMLETYTTVFLMANMFIHAYLSLYHPMKLLSKSFHSRTECPHCHGKLKAVETVGRKSEGYSLLRAENYLDEPEEAEAEAEAEASTGIIRRSTDSEA